jgi:hypothetical protein
MVEWRPRLGKDDLGLSGDAELAPLAVARGG